MSAESVTGESQARPATRPRILITGAAGQVAKRILPYLTANFDLVLTDRQASEIEGRKIQALDITDYSAVQAAMESVDAVVHLAIVSTRQVVHDKQRFNSDEGLEYLRFNDLSIDVNVRGTYHLFEAARAAGVKRFVFASSMTVVIGMPRYSEFHDALEPRPFNFYAVTKMWGENLGEYFSRRHGLTVYCLRFGQPVGQKIDPHNRVLKNSHPLPGILVSSEDLAGSVLSALTHQDGPAFGVYSIVSACKDSQIDYSKAEEIGWSPKSQTNTEDYE